MAQSSVYFSLLLVVVVIVESSGQGSPLCPVNTVYNECPQLQSCRPSCDNLKGAKVCALVCAPATCVCQAGYVLNSDGKCVKPAECPPKCPANQQWSKCPKPLECRPSCKQLNGAEVCIDICEKAGCVCKDGFVLNSDGECVEPSTCPAAECPANSTRVSCAQQESCRPSCENPKGAEVCPAICIVDDCVCDKGYVLNEDGECVLPSECC